MSLTVLGFKIHWGEANLLLGTSSFYGFGGNVVENLDHFRIINMRGVSFKHCWFIGRITLEACRKSREETP